MKVFYSDCGTNYISANVQLNEIYNFLESDLCKHEMSNELAQRRIE